MSSARAREQWRNACGWVAGAGGKSVTYKIRDWLISRQRYWGTPIPIVYCERCGESGVPDEELPILLPPREWVAGETAASADGRLAAASMPEFMTATCPKCGGAARRERATQWTPSSMRSGISALSRSAQRSRAVGSAARRNSMTSTNISAAPSIPCSICSTRASSTKFFRERGWVSGSDKPFERLFHQGMVLRDSEKMSKSRGNVIGIDETAERNGVDAMRLFLLYVTPPEETSNWTDDGISGRVRLAQPHLARLRNCFSHPQRNERSNHHRRTACLPISRELRRDYALLRASPRRREIGNRTSRYARRFHYNTTIARLDELVNLMTAGAAVRRRLRCSTP